jgi:hypothetical protein
MNLAVFQLTISENKTNPIPTSNLSSANEPLPKIILPQLNSNILLAIHIYFCT